MAATETDIRVREARSATYDLALFEQLNEEYRDRPLVPAPPALHSAGRMEAARKRLVTIARDVQIEGRRVLEIGTAHGHLAYQAVTRSGAIEAVGVDIVDSPQWEEFSGPGVRYLKTDLAREDALPPESVDLVISNAVLEHVDRPLPMLAAIARALSPGGEAWLNFNLYRGPKASHRYREVFFPWPHLLFDSDVGAAFYREHHARNATFAWVNHLTAAEYLDACDEIGLSVDALRRSKTAIDIPFYLRFEEKLGRYPALDLESDFMWIKLRKGPPGSDGPPRLEYWRRQQEFYAEIDALQA